MGVRARLSLLVVFALLAAACSGGGDGGQDAREQLRGALRAMSQDDGVTMTLSLDTDEASLAAMAAEAGEPIPPEAAAFLTGGAVRVSVPYDAEREGAGFALALLLDGEALVELRAGTDVLYLRAQAARLLEALGQDPAMLEGARAMLAQSGVLPPDVLDGRWIALRGMEDALEQMTGQDLDAMAGGQARSRAAVERLGQALADASEVERAGEDERGDRLRVSVPLRELYDAFLAEAETLGLPTPLPSEMPAREDVPDVEVVLDVWVRDGRLTAAGFDLLQMRDVDPEFDVPEGVDRLALDVGFEAFDGRVEAPADAVDVDGEALMGMLFMSMGQAMMEGGGGMMPGMEPGMPPTAGGAAFGQEQAAAPDAVLVAFYGHPAYGEARRRYCADVADMPEPVRRRHFGDICPLATA